VCVCIVDKCNSLSFHETEQFKLVSNTEDNENIIIIRTQKHTQNNRLFSHVCSGDVC